jgi:hypothetical protein
MSCRAWRWLKADDGAGAKDADDLVDPPGAVGTDMRLRRKRRWVPGLRARGTDLEVTVGAG